MHKEIALSRGVAIMSTDGMVVPYIKFRDVMMCQ